MNFNGWIDELQHGGYNCNVSNAYLQMQACANSSSVAGMLNSIPSSQGAENAWPGKDAWRIAYHAEKYGVPMIYEDMT